MANDLLRAFKTISKQQRAPRRRSSLTFSENRMYEQAVLIYTTLPDGPGEIREAFHCRLASAEKIYKALKNCRQGECKAKAFHPKRRGQKVFDKVYTPVYTLNGGCNDN